MKIDAGEGGSVKIYSVPGMRSSSPRQIFQEFILPSRVASKHARRWQITLPGGFKVYRVLIELSDDEIAKFAEGSVALN